MDTTLFHEYELHEVYAEDPVKGTRYCRETEKDPYLHEHDSSQTRSLGLDTKMPHLLHETPKQTFEDQTEAEPPPFSRIQTPMILARPTPQ